MRPCTGSTKCSGRQELADPLIGLVVGQQRAQQRLLRLLVGRRLALGQAEQGCVDLVHVEAESKLIPAESGQGACLWMSCGSGGQHCSVVHAPPPAGHCPAGSPGWAAPHPPGGTTASARPYARPGGTPARPRPGRIRTCGRTARHTGRRWRCAGPVGCGASVATSRHNAVAAPPRR